MIGRQGVQQAEKQTDRLTDRQKYRRTGRKTDFAIFISTVHCPKK
jgi:hypothetical protein